MKTLLSITTQRHLALLEILYYNKEWLPIKHLSEQLNCSESIIRRDIELTNVHYKPFKIVNNKKRGIILDIPAQMTIEYIYEIILATSTEFALVEALFFQPKMTAQALSEELFISQSTLARMIARCNKYLRSWHIHLSTAPYEIVGNELQIRNFFTHFFKEKYSLTDAPINIELIESLHQLLITKTKSLGIKLTYSEIELITFMLLTIAPRVKSGNLINFPTNAVKEHPWLELFLLDETFNRLFKQEFQMNWDVLMVEQVFYPFLNDTFFFSLQDFNSATTRSLAMQNRLSEISNLLTMLSSELAIPLSNKDKLLMTLYNYHFFFIGNNHLLFDKNKQFVWTVSEEYPKTMTRLRKTLLEFKFFPEFEWSETSLNETIYLLVTNWQAFLPYIHQQLPIISVLISCTFELPHAHFLKELLNLRITNNLEITISTAQTIPEHLAALINYDLVLTNTDKLEHQHSQVLCINPLPNFRDWQNIQTALINC